jgi:hypothetical protein
MVTATVIGDEALAAKFNAAAAALIDQERFWLHDVGQIVELSIKQNIVMQGLVRGKADNPAHPHLIDTGRVFGLTAHGVSVGFGKGHPAADALEFGAIAHAIVSSDRMLSFWWENRGDWFFGTQVWHPGNIAYRYVYNGTLNAVIPVCKFFVSRVAAIFGGL